MKCTFPAKLVKGKCRVTGTPKGMTKAVVKSISPVGLKVPCKVTVTNGIVMCSKPRPGEKTCGKFCCGCKKAFTQIQVTKKSDPRCKIVPQSSHLKRHKAKRLQEKVQNWIMACSALPTGPKPWALSGPKAKPAKGGRSVQRNKEEGRIGEDGSMLGGKKSKRGGKKKSKRGGKKRSKRGGRKKSKRGGKKKSKRRGKKKSKRRGKKSKRGGKKDGSSKNQKSHTLKLSLRKKHRNCHFSVAVAVKICQGIGESRKVDFPQAGKRVLKRTIGCGCPGGLHTVKLSSQITKLRNTFKKTQKACVGSFMKFSSWVFDQLKSRSSAKKHNPVATREQANKVSSFRRYNLQTMASVIVQVCNTPLSAMGEERKSKKSEVQAKARETRNKQEKRREQKSKAEEKSAKAKDELAKKKKARIIKRRKEREQKAEEKVVKMSKQKARQADLKSAKAKERRAKVKVERAKKKSSGSSQFKERQGKVAEKAAKLAREEKSKLRGKEEKAAKKLVNARKKLKLAEKSKQKKRTEENKTKLRKAKAKEKRAEAKEKRREKERQKETNTKKKEHQRQQKQRETRQKKEIQEEADAKIKKTKGAAVKREMARIQKQVEAKAAREMQEEEAQQKKKREAQTRKFHARKMEAAVNGFNNYYKRKERNLKEIQANEKRDKKKMGP